MASSKFYVDNSRSEESNVMYGTLTITFIFLPSLATFVFKDIKNFRKKEGKLLGKISNLDFWNHLPVISLFTHGQMFLKLTKAAKTKSDVHLRGKEFLKILTEEKFQGPL